MILVHLGDADLLKHWLIPVAVVSLLITVTLAVLCRLYRYIKELLIWIVKHKVNELTTVFKDHDVLRADVGQF